MNIIKEWCASFSVELLEKYSIREAALLEYLANRLTYAKCPKDDDGTPWFTHSARQFSENLPFIKRPRDILEKLVKDGILKKRHMNKWNNAAEYTFSNKDMLGEASPILKRKFSVQVALDCPRGAETTATVFYFLKIYIQVCEKNDPKFDGLQMGPKAIHKKLQFLGVTTIHRALQELVERQYLERETRGFCGAVYRLKNRQIEPLQSLDHHSGNEQGYRTQQLEIPYPAIGIPYPAIGIPSSAAEGYRTQQLGIPSSPISPSGNESEGYRTQQLGIPYPAIGIPYTATRDTVDSKPILTKTSSTETSTYMVFHQNDVTPALGAPSDSHSGVTSCGRPLISKPSCEPSTPSNATTTKQSLKHIPDYMIACGKIATTNSSKFSVSLPGLLEGYSTDVSSDSILTDMFYNVLVHDFGELENKQDFSFSYLSRYFGKFEPTDHEIYDVERILPADKTLARYGNVLLSCIRQFNQNDIPFELENPDLKALCNFLTRFPDDSAENISSVLHAVLCRRGIFMKDCPPTSATGTYSIASYPGLGRDLKTTHCTTLRYFFAHYHFFLKAAADCSKLDISCYTEINPDRYKCKNSDYLSDHVQLDLWISVKKMAQHVANRLGRLAFRMEACLAFRETLLAGAEGNPSSLNQCSADVDIWGLTLEKYAKPMSIEFYIWATKVAKQLNAPLFASLAYTRPFIY